MNEARKRSRQFAKRMIMISLFANSRHKMQPARRQWTALVAIFAIVTQMLLPLGQALAFDSGQNFDYQNMCLPDGYKFSSSERNDTPTVPTNSVPCPLCTLQLAPTLPTPQEITIIIIDAPAQHAVFSLPHQHTRTSIWRDALQPSRAPPISI